MSLGVEHFDEEDLRLTLPKGIGRKFDGDDHKLSHCMKAVDFIIEWKERLYFVEFKDLDNPKIPQKEKLKKQKEYESGKIDSDLCTKYRDSLLYIRASGDITKDIHYIVILECAVFDTALLMQRADKLRQKLPFNGPAGRPWPKPIAKGCNIMNMAMWNRIFPQFPISRISAIAA